MKVEIEGVVASIGYYKGDEDKPYTVVEFKHKDTAALPGFGTTVYLVGIFSLGRKIFATFADSESKVEEKSETKAKIG